MIDKITIKEEANGNLQAAYDYYEEQKQGWVMTFLEKVKERIKYLEKYPLHFAKVHKDFRQTLIDKFPFLMIYELTENAIIVYAVFHSSRNPKKKFK